MLTSNGREAQIRDAETHRPIFPPLVNEGRLVRGEFSKDGARVCVTGRTAMQRTNVFIQIWDALTGLKVGGPLRGLRPVFDLDGGRVLTQEQGNLHLWDALSGDLILSITTGSNSFGQFFFLDEDRFVFSEPYTGLIRIYRARAGGQLDRTIHQHDQCFSTTATRDGERIASFCGRHAHVWDTRTGQEVTTPILLNDTCQLAFSPDGNRLAGAGGANDPVIRIWDLSRTDGSRALKHNGWVFHAGFSPDGQRIVTASDDGSAQVWNASTGQALGPRVHTNHRSDYSLFVHYPLGRVFHPVTEQQVKSVPAASGSAQVFHPVLGDKSGNMNDAWRWLNNTNKGVFFAAFSPDSRRVITAGYDGAARVWDPESGRELIPPLLHEGAIYHAVFSPEGRRIVTASGDWTAQVWDATTGRKVGAPLSHQGAVLYAQFSPNGRRVITASYDMTAQLWDAETGAKISPALEHPNPDNGPVFTAKFSPDGERVVTASYDGSGQIWNARTGQKLTPPFRHRGFMYYAEFSPEGTKVLTAGEGAQVWDATTGARMTPWMSAGEVLNRAVFSADGKRIVTASLAGHARIWDATTGLPLTPRLQHGDKTWHAEFSPSGRQVLTASSDGTARVWPVETTTRTVEDLRNLAELLAGRRLDETKSLTPLTSEELNARWRSIDQRR